MRKYIAISKSHKANRDFFTGTPAIRASDLEPAARRRSCFGPLVIGELDAQIGRRVPWPVSDPSPV
jgi:hypothetical protein